MLRAKGKSLLALRRAAAPFAVVTAVALGLSGCGGSGGSGKKDDVASLQQDSKKPAASASSADRGQGGPRLRLDSTDDEVRALWNAYYSCLKDHGGKVEQITGPKAAGKYMLSGANDKEQPPAAVKACTTKRPIPVPETDPDQNPHYADDFRDWVKCLNDRGIPVKALPDASGWNYDKSMSEDEKGSPRTQRIERECEIQAFKK
ncbi:hypothetical protein ACWDG1_41220 [Streptomyces sp. NPDC001177]